MIHTVGIIALISYLIACVFGIFAIIRHISRRVVDEGGDNVSNEKRITAGRLSLIGNRRVSRLFIVANIAQLFGLFATTGLCILLWFTSSNSNPTQYFLWIAVLFELLIRAVRLNFPMINLGGAVLTTVLLLGSSTLLHVQVGSSSPGPFVVITHVLPALFGFACVFGILLVSALFIFQYRLLKRKKLSDLSLQTTPGLARLESAHHLMTALGVASFTLAILIGALVLPSTGRALSWWFDTSIMSTVLAWILLLVLLQLRYVAAPMRYLALVTVIGSGVLTLTVLGIGMFKNDGSIAHIVCLGCEKS